MCDGKGPTLTVIKTTTGHIFGGYTSVSWDKSDSFKYDYNAFLFSVNKLTKYPIVNSHANAIRCHPSYGPTFGNGYNISVKDNSNANTDSYVTAGNAYNIPAGVNEQSILTNGNRNFQTVEIEVYGLN